MLDLQLTVELPFARDAAGASGLGNIALAAKYRFLGQEDFGLDVSFFPHLILPSASAVRKSIGLTAAPMRDVADRVVSVVEHTEQGAALVFEIESPPGLTLPGKSEELSEILGALVENAARYARRRVRIIAGADDASACLLVEDDGPGLQDWQGGRSADPGAAAGRNRARSWPGAGDCARPGGGAGRQHRAETLGAGRAESEDDLAAWLRPR